MAEHWWRAYDSSIDHPKLLKLSDAMHRAWYTLQCISSANGGALPPTSDIALRLRVKPAKVAGWIAHLVAGGLIDRTGDVFRPHNWDERQYKIDSSSPASGKKDSYVYFVGRSWGSTLKIGFSKNPWARIVELQTAHHEKIEVLAAFRCKAASEVDLHEILKEHRKSGEWFDLPVNIYVAIHNASDRSNTYEQLVAELRQLLRSTTTEADTESEQKVDRIGNAGASAFTQGSKALSTSFLEALGFLTPLSVPLEFAGVEWRAIGWETAGWTADLIATEARKVGSGKPLTYHEKCFATAFAKRQAPLPIVEIKQAERLTVKHGSSQGNSGSLIAAIDRQLAAIEAEASTDFALPESAVLRISG